jgi:hypothetical protein
MLGRLLNAIGKRFVGTCLTLAALWTTDHLTDVPKYTNYAAVVGLVVVIVGIVGAKRGWASKYRKMIFHVDSWFLGAIALLILGIAAEKQLDLFNVSAPFLFNYLVAVFLVAGILLPTPLFMLADWIGQFDKRIEDIVYRRRASTILDLPGATLIHPLTRKQLVLELMRKFWELLTL